MLTDIVKPGSTEAILIKTQHNCVSNGRTYSNNNWVAIMHEYLLVLKKLERFLINFQLPTEHTLDIRNSQSATWRDVLSAVMGELKEASLDDIYREIGGYKKAKLNKHWKEKVRQTLQLSDRFTSKGRGVWAVAA